MSRTSRSFVVLVGMMVGSALLLPQAGARASRPSARVAALAPAGSTPALIEAAVARGVLDRRSADRLLAAALGNPSRVPAAYRSDVPWRGTLPLLALQRRAEAAGTTLSRLAGTTARRGRDRCGGYGGDMPGKHLTEHFLIRYDRARIRGGLTIRRYGRALETSWRTQIGTFGWPKPPFMSGARGRYHVRVENLGDGLYGFVSTGGTTAGPVGNNPATSFADRDAYATCMVLNEDYRGFPSEPLGSLQSTAAHELNHAIQFGEGALTGVGAPDLVFVEAGATWMEDEVFDGANDSTFYLWPSLRNSMGAYPETGAVYSYWIVIRALTERFGTGVAGGGEDVMQRFWGLTGREAASNLEAMDGGLRPEGVSLPSAFHAAAISIRLARPCGGGYVAPTCLEEGADYRNMRGHYPSDNAIASAGGRATGSVRDDYAAYFVGLPEGGRAYGVELTNRDTGGALRGSVVCDTGSSLRIDALSRIAGPGQRATLADFDPSGCASVILAITNQDQHGANPSASARRDFSVDTS